MVSEGSYQPGTLLPQIDVRGTGLPNLVGFCLRHPRIPVFTAAILILLGACLLASVIAPFDPKETLTAERLQSPSTRHLLGTDQLGRDTFSRLLYGGRTAIPLGLMAVTIASLVGVALGVAAGYFGGLVDEATGRLVDAQLAFPELILAIAVVNTFGANLTNVMIVVGLTGYPSSYRLARAQVLQAKELEYVTAARALGASELRLIGRHILPNVLNPLVVNFSIAAGSAVLLQSTLGFFGLGPAVGTPDWGQMFYDALANYRIQPWLMVGPGFVVFLSVLSFYTLGDALRDALDPRLRGARA